MTKLGQQQSALSNHWTKQSITQDLKLATGAVGVGMRKGSICYVEGERDLSGSLSSLLLLCAMVTYCVGGAVIAMGAGLLAKWSPVQPQGHDHLVGSPWMDVI